MYLSSDFLSDPDTNLELLFAFNSTENAGFGGNFVLKENKERLLQLKRI